MHQIAQKIHHFAHPTPFAGAGDNGMIRTTMSAMPKVIFLVERSRAYGRLLLRGVAQYSKLHGPWLFFMEPEFYVKGLAKSYRWMEAVGADGVIAPLWDGAIIDMIVNLGLPAVICGIERPSLNACRIVTDDAAVGRMAAEYFLNRGFRRFAFCGFDDAIWSSRRGESFMRTVAEDGFETYVYQQPKSKRHRTAEMEPTLIAEWLKSLPRPIALMACNDDRGRDVLMACRIAGLQVPGEVAVLGVDNDELVCDLSYPRLSSIATSTERAGYEAARVLDRLMKGQETEDVRMLADAAASEAAREVVVTEKDVVASPLYVVTRQSTDVMAIEDQYAAEAVRFIRGHSKDVIQVDDVAQAVGLSRRALEQRFRRALDRSVHDEIQYVRINQRASMLTNTNLPISQITRLLGYPYSNNVSRCFKQLKGLSPSRYRRDFGLK
jgi:LacI family transcriptional regulator